MKIMCANLQGGPGDQNRDINLTFPGLRLQCGYQVPLCDVTTKVLRHDYQASLHLAIKFIFSSLWKSQEIHTDRLCNTALKTLDFQVLVSLVLRSSGPWSSGPRFSGYSLPGNKALTDQCHEKKPFLGVVGKIALMGVDKMAL